MISRDVHGSGHLSKMGYKYELDGQSVPNITSVLGAINKPGLYHWFANIASEATANAIQSGLDHATSINTGRAAPRNTSREMANIGTLVHKLVSDMVEGTPVDIEAHEDSLGEKGMTCIQSFKGYRDSNGLDDSKIIGVEVILFSKSLGIAGTCDLVYQKPSGTYVVVDWKTGERIYPSQYLQTFFYARALQEEGTIPWGSGLKIHAVSLNKKRASPRPYKPKWPVNDYYSCMELIKSAKKIYLAGI